MLGWCLSQAFFQNGENFRYKDGLQYDHFYTESQCFSCTFERQRYTYEPIHWCSDIKCLQCFVTQSQTGSCVDMAVGLDEFVAEPMLTDSVIWTSLQNASYIAVHGSSHSLIAYVRLVSQHMTDDMAMIYLYTLNYPEYVALDEHQQLFGSLAITQSSLTGPYSCWEGSCTAKNPLLYALNETMLLV